MTAEALARLTRARSIGKGKWVARCPAHRDRNPSLSIGIGKDGRVLVHCFAGCRHTAVLEALGLCERDLFDGPAPHSLHISNANIIAHEAEREQALRRSRGDLSDEYRRLSRVVDALGAKLARTPDRGTGGDAMTQLFHQALQRLRTVEAKLNKGCKC